VPVALLNNSQLSKTTTRIKRGERQPRYGGLTVPSAAAPDRIPTDAAGRTRARFLDCPPAGDGGHRHDAERQFFGPGFHPGDYVFTFVTDALRIRTRSDSGSTASPRRPWSRAFPSMGHYATHRGTTPLIRNGALNTGVSPKIISERHTALTGAPAPEGTNPSFIHR
jgi:hypothetical protein